MFSFPDHDPTPNPGGRALLPDPDHLAITVPMAWTVTNLAVPPIRNGINVTFSRIGPNGSFEISMDHTWGPTDPSKKKKRELSPLPSRKRTEQSRQRTLLVSLSPALSFLSFLPATLWSPCHVPEPNTEPSSDHPTQVCLSTLLRPTPVPPPMSEVVSALTGYLG